MCIFAKHATSQPRCSILVQLQRARRHLHWRGRRRCVTPLFCTLPPRRSYIGAEVVAPIEREIRALAHGLTSVKDEQEYIVVRERTHRNTAESTNGRVKWWSILQAVVLFSVVAWQVYYLKVTFSSSSSAATWLTRLFSLSLKSKGLFRAVVEFCPRLHMLHIYYRALGKTRTSSALNTISAG